MSTDKQTLSKKTLQEAVKCVMKELERLRAENADLQNQVEVWKQRGSFILDVSLQALQEDKDIDTDLEEYLAWIQR